jgi:uncharacterized membrane protein YjjP (DUF1212 family)
MTDYRTWLVLLAIAVACGVLTLGVLKLDVGAVVKMVIAVVIGIVVVQDLAFTRRAPDAEAQRRDR